MQIDADRIARMQANASMGPLTVVEPPEDGDELKVELSDGTALAWSGVTPYVDASGALLVFRDGELLAGLSPTSWRLFGLQGSPRP